jgi:two-component system sensor histidine kinase/response regulator
MHILIAEDNRVNQLVLTCLLRKQGHTVAVANNGREAVAALAERACDLVLMDIQMPEMDGFEATAYIRTQERSTGAHIPIIAVTAHTMDNDRARCLAAGMDGYAAKPIQVAELLRVIAEVTTPGSSVATLASAISPSGQPCRQLLAN